ncbi:MAG: DUF2249 domain-containing protein [Chitinophagaceae bacterium]|nr:DUF2249 domain-containing protein [Chitinophagaceae bacterium]
MKINDNTKISELIKANKNCIDAIAGVAKPFHRLRNPILRKVMASRVSIAEAAKMGGCTVEAIVAALTPLGFEYEKRKAAENTGIQSKPQWLSQAGADSIVRYDVRPIIESGTDPLKMILARFKDVPPSGILCIINSFVPTPLIHLLKQEKAEDSYVDTISEKESHTYFLKKKKENIAEKTTNDKVIMDDAASFQAVYDSFAREKIKETDVRNMEMPMPMQTILGELHALPEGNMLYVHHKRIPVYLLEELADKNYEVHIHTVDDSNVKMILFEKQ